MKKDDQDERQTEYGELQTWREWRGTVKEAFRHIEESTKDVQARLEKIPELLAKKADKSDLDICFDKVDRCRDRCDGVMQGMTAKTSENSTILEGLRVKLVLYGVIGGAGFACIAYLSRLFVELLRNIGKG